MTKSSDEAIHEGSTLSGLIDTYHRSIRINPARDEPHLNALVGGQGKAQGESGSVLDRRHAPEPCRFVDEIKRSYLVIGPPSSPIGDSGGDFGKGDRDSAGDGCRHGSGLPHRGNSFGGFAPIGERCEVAS